MEKINENNKCVEEKKPSNRKKLFTCSQYDGRGALNGLSYDCSPININMFKIMINIF